MKKILYTAIILLGLISCKDKPKPAESTPEKELISEEMTKISFEMTPKSNSEVKGTVTFSQENGGQVMMMAYLSGLTPGTHAIHLHETADCS